MVVIKNLSKAEPAEMRSLQLVELNILKEFKNICEANNLRFFLGGGSCIGAVRHKGFIPWDDDVDVFMPRRDYEFLWKNWQRVSKNPEYSLCRSTKTQNYRHAAMTLNDNNTTFINFRTIDQDVNQGIAIDIIPMDSLPKSNIKRVCQVWNALWFSVFINQRIPDHQGKTLRVLTGLPLWLISSQSTRYKVWKHAESKIIDISLGSDKGHTVGKVELVTGFKSIFRQLPSKWFDEVKWVPFEDTLMPIPAGYTEYLESIFGDFMSLPPASERQAKHNTVLVDTENSYLQYKGKLYLKD